MINCHFLGKENITKSRNFMHFDSLMLYEILKMEVLSFYRTILNNVQRLKCSNSYVKMTAI